MSEFVKSASPELATAMVEYITSTYPGLTSGQTTALVELALNDGLVSLTRDFGIELKLDTVGYTLADAIKSNPRLVSRIPSVSELVELESKRHAAHLGTPLDVTDRISLSRRVAAMSDDEKLAMLPAGTKLEASTAVPEASTPAGQKKPFRSMDPFELDAEVSERFGVSRHDISVAQRQTYHNALRNLDTNVETPVNDMINSGVRSESDLSPSERIRRFRESERLKAR